MKPGYKTTEFYMALATAVLPVIKQYLFPSLPDQVMLGLIGVAVTYIASRTVLKMK